MNGLCDVYHIHVAHIWLLCMNLLLWFSSASRRRENVSELSDVLEALQLPRRNTQPVSVFNVHCKIQCFFTIVPQPLWSWTYSLVISAHAFLSVLQLITMLHKVTHVLDLLLYHCGFYCAAKSVEKQSANGILLYHNYELVLYLLFATIVPTVYLQVYSFISSTLVTPMLLPGSGNSPAC